MLAHASNHSVEIGPLRQRIRVKFAGEIIAQTNDALIVRETGLPERLYVPPTDIHHPLEPSPLRSTCPYKGEARYWTLRINGHAENDIAWSYFNPTPIAEPIRDYVCFYPDRVSIERL